MGGCLPSYPQPPESDNSHTSALDSKKPGAHFKGWTYAETHNHNNIITSPEGGKTHEKKGDIEKKPEKSERRKSGGSGDGDSGDEGDHGDRALRH